MIFQRLSIDGYGRFSNREFELVPGLQVLAGPNEQGKSTIRHFIGEMLYGQKRSAVQRSYEDSNELRKPWKAENGYGGRLVYEMDSGRVIEIHRVFDRDTEKVRVYDVTNARDITSEFPRLKNKESTFAEQHLGMTKEVFLGLATVSHSTLDEFGDARALSQIREKLLSLTDSGTVQSSAESAVKWLQDRIAQIGQSTARTKPLPLARARLTDLQKEHEQAVHVRGEVADVETERAAVLEELQALERRRSEIEEGLRNHEIFERAERLRKAEKIAERIDVITRHCFSLGEVRDFPIEKAPEVHRLATRMSTAKLQIGKSKAERKEVEKQLADESKRTGADPESMGEDIDHKMEERLSELESRIQRLGDRLEESEKGRGEADTRYNDAQKDLSVLPDFGRFSPDPVEWLTQLANSFEIARRTRDDEMSKRRRLREAVCAKRDGLEDLDSLFSTIEDFPGEVDAYESATKRHEVALIEYQRDEDRLDALMDEKQSRLPGFSISALLALAMASVCAMVALLTANPWIYLPSLFAILFLAFSAVNVALTQRSLRRATRDLESITVQKRQTAESDKGQRKNIERLMEEAGAETLRELEAQFDRYREGRIALEEQEEQLRALDRQAGEAKERVDQLFERLKETFRRVGQEVAEENDVQTAAMRAVGNYQEYREAKRRSSENRQVLEKHEGEIKDIKAQLEECKKEELSLSLEVRQLLREAGYVDEHKFDSALKALRGYRIRSAQLRHNRGQVSLLQGKRGQIDRQIESEQREFAEQETLLAACLEEAMVSTFEEYQEKEAHAVDFKERWKERASLQEQLGLLLDGQDLIGLRDRVAGEAAPEGGPMGDLGELREGLDGINEEVDAKQKQAHALHIAMTERSAGARSINEIDEERAATGQRVRELELELQAASYSVSVIEEVTREQHSRVAPQLSAAASAYIKEITDGAYEEIMINRDMQVSVRIPQTKTLAEDPERFLSKGTVDQIYLALRLAMTQGANEDGERVPMLLDDPFASYDDARLERALTMLARIAKDTQILLFTCRDDVVAVAEKTDTPILTI